MKRNTYKIQIIKIADMGRNHDLWCDRVLMLRSARCVGDIEWINSTQLAALQRNASAVSFSVLEQSLKPDEVVVTLRSKDYRGLLQALSAAQHHPDASKERRQYWADLAWALQMQTQY